MSIRKTVGESLPDSSYVLIQSFMVRELGLTGNELLAYAVVYGFSQDEASMFFGTRNYIADWMGARSLRTVDACLGRLVRKGLIEKVEAVVGGKRVVAYRCTGLGSLGAKNAPGGAENAPSKESRKCAQGAENAPIYINNGNNRGNRKSSRRKKETKQQQRRTREESPVEVAKRLEDEDPRKSSKRERFDAMVDEARRYELRNCSEDEAKRAADEVSRAFACSDERQDMESQKTLCRQAIDEVFGYAVGKFGEAGRKYAGQAFESLGSKRVSGRLMSCWVKEKVAMLKEMVDLDAECAVGMDPERWFSMVPDPQAAPAW